MNRLRMAGLAASLLALQACIHNTDKAKQVALRRGQEYYGKGSYADAEIQFRKSLQEDPQFGEGYLWLGRAEERLGSYGPAMAALKQAAGRMPGQEAPEVALGNILLLAYLADPGKPGALYDQISAIAGDLLARHADSFDGLRLNAYLAASGSDPGKAAELFEKANLRRPGQPDIVTALAENLIRVKRGAEAEKISRDFLAQRPDYGPLYTMLYEYYRRAGRGADAEAMLVSKAARNPKEALYRIELARHYARSGAAAKAADVVTGMLADAKTFPHAGLDAGDFYADQKDWGAAKRYYLQGIQSDPKAKLVYWRRLVPVALASGDAGAARQMLDQILKAQPDDAGSQAARASLRMASADPAQKKLGIAEFKILADKRQDHFEYRLQYAEALGTDGQNEAARAQYLLVLQKQPRNLTALERLAGLSIRRRGWTMR